MLTGKNPLSLPPYNDRAPVEYSVRCFCRVRYLIFNPPSSGAVVESESRACERAAQLQATFINSLLSPFVLCACGEGLDFSPGESVELVM